LCSYLISSSASSTCVANLWRTQWHPGSVHCLDP
jgi:hypothetical protein